MIHKERRELIWAYVLISLGGLLLNLRIHLRAQSLFDRIPCVFGMAGTVALPFLLSRPEAVAYAYLFTWAAV